MRFSRFTQHHWIAGALFFLALLATGTLLSHCGSSNASSGSVNVTIQAVKF